MYEFGWFLIKIKNGFYIIAKSRDHKLLIQNCEFRIFILVIHIRFGTIMITKKKTLI